MRPQDFRPDDLFAQISALEKALDAEQQARRQAEAANRAKSELLATVSHEVRTPMGAIISMADLLLSSRLNATERRYAETLQQSARGLLAVLNDILDYSKLEAGAMAIEPVCFDFREFMDGVAAALAARAQTKGLEASLQIADDCPRHVVGDPVRLRQVLNNLTDNAFKFTDKGGVRIAVTCASYGAHAVLRFEVVDTGIGMSDRQKERLFLPYVQADRSVAARYGGTGLGLSIARRLVELMGGDMGCESVEGRGSLFWFTAPLEQAPSATGGADATDATVGDGPLAGHVLVVEDNPVNQMVIGAYLERFGLTHDVAANGAEAIDALARRRFDLVLMDVMMPQVNGIEATQRIRALPAPLSAVPIVALTANAMKGDRETYLAAGMDGYVSKPINARDLFEALAEHLPCAAGAAASA